MPATSSPRVLPTHTPALFSEACSQAVAVLKAGGVAALPTETVYGLAANALDPAAVSSIFQIKGRPSHNPIIVHVSSLEMARECASVWPPTATRLAAAFWPGPLTLVLPRSAHIPDVVTAGGPTVGIRLPSHPFMRSVIEACGFPLAAPSANRSNEISPTTAAHCAKSLAGRVDCIIDGGNCQVGIESTVVDLSSGPMRVLRPGMISEDALLAALGGPPAAGAQPTAPLGLSGPLRSPGLLARHYAPRARLLVWRWDDEAALRRQLEELERNVKGVRIMAHSRIPLGLGGSQVILVPCDPEAFARALYAEWHRCDDEGVGAIVVEEPPEGSDWDGIRDRLKRASTPA